MKSVLLLILTLVPNIQMMISENCSKLGTIESNSNRKCVCKVKIILTIS